MTLALEYHVSVRHSIPASLALFSLFALPVISVSTSHAQTNSSATSSKSSAHFTTSAPTSAAAFGASGHPHNSPVTSKPTAPAPGDRRHHHYVKYTPPAVYVVAVPYAIDIGATDGDDDATQNGDDSDANYQGGPTVFDRRGSGEDSYVPPVDPVPTPHSASADDADVAVASPEPPREPTLLIFKDGHQLELGNYAIIGAILFDLTPGRARRIALADLDLEATRKHNDDRGISFQLPPPPQAN